jgi:tetratricopeptide (TPR) repeat protein
MPAPAGGAMKIQTANCAKIFVLAVLLFYSGVPVLPQSASSPQAGANKPASETTPGKDASPLDNDNLANNAPSRETKAFNSFQAIPDAQFDKKVKAGEDFLHKYANSAYVPLVDAILSVTYIQGNQPDKGFEYGEKAIAQRPNDTRTLANLAQSLARLNNPSDPNATQKLQQAEDYAKKCIQITPTLTKPQGATDEQFTAVNNINLAMAHSALGTVDIRRADYAQAIPDLQEAIRLDAGKDATNFYLLGVASANSSHYAEAVDAFNKCVAAGTVPAKLQQACRDGATEAQKNITSK